MSTMDVPNNKILLGRNKMFRLTILVKFSNILGFDIYLIKELYKMHGADYKPLVPKIIDTNCIARGIKMDIPYKAGEDFLEYQYRIYNTRRKGIKTNMTALGKEFDIKHDYENLHNALVDLEPVSYTHLTLPTKA